jgi:lysophospholipase L1-like esterase
MARLAQEVGVPGSAIHTELGSRSTYENARLAAPLLRWLGVQRVLVVTDRLHLRRASGAFAAQGFSVERRSVPTYDGHANNTAMLVAGLREYAGLYYYKMHGWIESGTTSSRVPATVGASTSGREMRVANRLGPVIVLGASYAGSWKLDHLGQFAVINKGVSGQQSFEMLERFDGDVVAARPRAVILWGFINDIFRAQNADNAVARARDSFRRMVARAQEHGIEPIIVTEVTIRPAASWLNPLAALFGTIRGKESYQARVNRYVLETNEWLVDLARREELLMLDFQSMTADGNGMRRKEYAAEDGSHIPAEGYAALTSYAKPILEQHFAATP